MSKTRKIWTGLGITLGVMATTAQAADTHVHSKHLLLAANTATAGEGEGAETDASNAANDVSYLAMLGYVEGHMTVGTALYAKGEVDYAKTHMKHPADEIYTDLKPLLDQRKMKGFSAELEAVSAAVESGKPAADVTKLVDNLFAAIKSQRPANLNAKTAVLAIKDMVRTAGEEFSIGVKEGKIDKVHEFQDAWGFVQTAKRLLKTLPEAETVEHKADLDKIMAELDGLDPLWPDIAGKKPVTGKPEALFAAAARIELLAFGIN